ncbi:hypothetical protein [Metabacillus halosaccharovorans]|uniref:hypothetical protein n=1 Tax=Metabacillus halosaccharovorans TaxID=930124 RepID=UPI001C1F944B|nr:hypothetical protein [Metabacillus halosaccharovorans]
MGFSLSGFEDITSITRIYCWKCSSCLGTFQLALGAVTSPLVGNAVKGEES